MATTSISLIREQSERVTPPRALWVPFPLGRPLGAADDAEFQHGVLAQALDLLTTATEPTIVDYDGPVPDVAATDAPLACPVNLTAPPDGSLSQQLRDEVARLRPWAEETRRARGRTLFGASGATPDQVAEVAQALASIAENGVADAPTGPIEWRFEMPLLIRHLADDLRTLYHEAISAQPGTAAPTHDDLNDWIFDGSALGTTLVTIADHLTAAGDEYSALVRGLLIPEGRLDRATFAGVQGHDHDDG